MNEATRRSPEQKPESTMQPASLRGMDDQMMTEYLLGELTTVQQEQFENALFSDPSLYHKLMIVEDRLIDDYLCCQLTQTQQKRFEQYFLISERRRAKFALGQTFITTLWGFNDSAGALAKKSLWRLPLTIRGFLTLAALVISFLFVAAFLMVWRAY